MNNSLKKYTSISVFILCGGKSTRMGQDKGLLPLDGKPMIQHVVDAVKDLFPTILLSTSDTQSYTKFGYPMVQDCYEDIGPIGGIYSCLQQSTTQHNLILTCDSPYIDKSIILQLIGEIDPEYDAVYLEDQNQVYPLSAIYNKNALEEIAQAIQNQDYKVRNVFKKIKTKAIHLTPEESLKLVNFNSPEDLKMKI